MALAILFTVLNKRKPIDLIEHGVFWNIAPVLELIAEGILLFNVLV